MCPCPNSGNGLTVLYLENIKDSSEYDKYVLGLFEANLVVEGSFEAQLQRYSKGADEKVSASEAENLSLHLVCHDDKVDQVMSDLDRQNLTLKSTDFKLSPLLKGKTEYLKWQQSSATAIKSPTRVVLGGDEGDDMDDEMDEEEA